MINGNDNGNDNWAGAVMFLTGTFFEVSKRPKVERTITGTITGLARCVG